MTSRPWLLLIHQIPAKPDYLRVKVGRRLQQVGAVPVKSSVYALPDRPDCRESLQWILREVAAGGGEAVLCAVDLVEGLSDDELRGLFREARRADYEALAAEAREALATLQASTEEGRGPARTALRRSERRLAALEDLDFFAAPGREAALAALAALRAGLSADRPPAAAAPRGLEPGRTWVTRPGVEVDRIASAWLIRRFLDPAARFRFLPVAAADDGIRFDMYEAEHTHEGDRCTFEVLLERFELAEPALAAVGEIVHDLDLRDEKLARPETPGVERALRGLLRAEPDDAARLEKGGALFESLYRGFGGER